MGCSRGGSSAAAAWRSAGAAAVALCLLPVVLPLVLLCLPLLCIAVAFVRFRRHRRRVMAASGGSCCVGARGQRPQREAAEGTEPHRVALLEKYLEDQMELVGAEAGDAMAAAPPRKPWPA